MKKSCLFIGGSRDGEWIGVEVLPNYTLPEIWKIDKIKETLREGFKNLSQMSEVMYDHVEFEIYHKHTLRCDNSEWTIYTFNKVSTTTLLQVLIKGYKAE